MTQVESLQNAVQSEDDPSVVFATDEAVATIISNSAQPTLLMDTWAVVGPSGRMRMEWTQGSATGVASAKLAVWVTLRRSP